MSIKAFAGAVSLLHWAVAQDLSAACPHEDDINVEKHQEIRDGVSVYRDIRFNNTDRWYYMNENNVTVMNQPDQYRKVRKTRRCYPNPYSCIDLVPGQERREASGCQWRPDSWTHFLSEIDGSRDGSPTFFEVPLSATKYFISVYAPENSAYTLTVLSDIGAFPRPGANGRLTARQLSELQVQISWDAAGYIPTGISETKQYWVYSSMLKESDNRTNMAVFLRPDKIMNTVCGLQNNTDRQYTIIPASQCSNGKCNATIDGVITDKRYVFNVVAESYRGHKMAYSGLIMRTDWEVIRQAANDRTLRVVGAVSGSVLGMVIIIYFLMLKLYG